MLAAHLEGLTDMTGRLQSLPCGGVRGPQGLDSRTVERVAAAWRPFTDGATVQLLTTLARGCCLTHGVRRACVACRVLHVAWCVLYRPCVAHCMLRVAPPVLYVAAVTSRHTGAALVDDVDLR